MTLCRCESCWSSRWRSRDSSSGSHSLSASTTSSESRGEGAVDRGLVGAPARHLAGTAGAARIVVARSRHHLAVAGIGGVLRVLGLAVHRRALGGILRSGGSLALALVFAVAFLAALLLVAFRLVVDLAEVEVEILQQSAGRPRIGVLVEDRAVELAEILADAALDPRPPEIDDAPRRGRRPLPGQSLAGQQAHRLGHRAVGALGDPFKALPAILLVEHRREVGRDAGHPAGAQSLDARLLDRFEDRPRQRRAGYAPAVHLVVVIAQAQRHAVGGTAQVAPPPPPEDRAAGSATSPASR